MPEAAPVISATRPSSLLNSFSLGRVETRLELLGVVFTESIRLLEDPLVPRVPNHRHGAFLADLGLESPASDRFIQKAYELLDLISFLTAGPDECRAWTITRGTNAQRAAGKIHSDLERGFIRAEVYCVADLEEHGTEAALKPAGKLRVEGKNYTVQDGDVMNIRFNV